jgi:hypothetical protein
MILVPMSLLCGDGEVDPRPETVGDEEDAIEPLSGDSDDSPEPHPAAQTHRSRTNTLMPTVSTDMAESIETDL